MLRDRYTCQLCHRRHRARELDVDHIVEIARGGAALEFSNLQTICRACHREKTVRFLRDARMPSSLDPGSGILSATPGGAARSREPAGPTV